MEEEIQARLAAEVTGVVAWGQVPDGSGLPATVMNRTGGARMKSLDGASLMEGRLQVDCYGETALQAMTTSREVRRSLEEYVGGSILHMALDDINDQIEGDVREAHRVMLRFSLTYRETL